MTYIRASIATWKIDADSAEAQTIVQQVQSEGVAVLRQQPGFIQYRSGYADSRTSINIYEWTSEEECTAGVQQFVAWLQRTGIMNQTDGIDAYSADAIIST
ncbi:MAG: hypothetical protein NVS2B7_00900 [Herpetosiphon sp.]